MKTAVIPSQQDQSQADQSGLVLIPDNFDAFAARVLVAREAKHSLDLMYYIWRDDHCGKILLDEVIAAAQRGAKVRLLIDDINPQASDATYLRLDDKLHIEVKLFNPSRARTRSMLRLFEMIVRMNAMTRRMHGKAWIADRQRAIIGGRNIGDEYFDAAEVNFRDLDFLAEGAAAEQASLIFDAYWEHEASVSVHRLHPMRKRRRGVPKPRTSRAPEVAAKSVAEFVANAKGMHWVQNVRVIADPPDKVVSRRKGNWMMHEVLPIIRSAQTTLDIVSPYFVPGREGVASLATLVRDGVSASVVTNSLAATDVAAVHGAYSNYRKSLLRSGVKLYEFKTIVDGPKLSVFGSKGASLHTKAFTVDGRIGFVGSLNFDPRSAALNAEMGIIFEDASILAELSDSIEREKSRRRSYRVRLDGRKLSWEGEDDAAAQRFAVEPGASYWRRFIAGLVRLLPIESQL